MKMKSSQFNKNESSQSNENKSSQSIKVKVYKWKFEKLYLKLFKK